MAASWKKYMEARAIFGQSGIYVDKPGKYLT